MGCAASRRRAGLREAADAAEALAGKVHALEEEVMAQSRETAALRKTLAAERRRRQELEMMRLLSKEEFRMKAEQETRDVAVDKWKQLYLAIKAELDALILRAKQGNGMWVAAAEEAAAARWKAELRAKEAAEKALRARWEAAVESLRAQLAAAKAQAAEQEREIDILRQSLRILTAKLKSRVPLRRHLRC
ncbi:troponin T, skeletal protein [Wolffia australiana]